MAYRADAAVLDDVFLRQLRLRQRIARQAGFGSYLDYRWRQLSRFDSTPGDAARLVEAVEHEVLPLLRRVMVRRAARLGLDTVRPWDTWVDPDAARPLQPFPDAAALEAGVAHLFAQLDPELGAVVEGMRDGNLDLGLRSHKSADFGCCSHYPTTGRPFVLFPFDGSNLMLSGVLHELGHACHYALVCEVQPLV